MELSILWSKSELPSENDVHFFVIGSKVGLIIYFYEPEAISSSFFSHFNAALSKIAPAARLENSTVS